MKHLQKIPYKVLFSVLILAIAGIVFFFKIGSKTDKISAAWWNDGWYYRKAINIENSSGSDQNNVQIKLLDNYDLSSLNLPTTDYVLSKVFDLYAKLDNHENRAYYLFEDEKDNKLTYKL